MLIRNNNIKCLEARFLMRKSSYNLQYGLVVPKVLLIASTKAACREPCIKIIKTRRSITIPT